MNTAHLLVKAFRLGIGTDDQEWWCCWPELTTPTARLTAEYHYSPAIEEAATRPNGDPGDAPQQAELDVHALFAPVALHFADEEGVQVTLPARYDLRRCLSTAALIQIELAILKQIRGAAEEAVLDAYLGSRA